MIETTRQQRKALERANKDWPVEGREIPREQWPSDQQSNRVKVIRSRDYLIQVYEEADGVLRIGVNRTKLLGNGRWDDGMSWDELQQIKRIAGYAAWWAVEIYPDDSEVVNVANMRHLWVLPVAPSFAWRRAVAG